VSLPEIKTQQERKFDETFRVRICLGKKSQKLEKLMIRKVVASRKSKTHNRHWKNRHISVCECLTVIFKMLHWNLYLNMHET